MNMLETELLFNARFNVDPRQDKWFDVGDGGSGRRLIVPVGAEGGTFEGPRVKGTLEPSFGADWILFRPDGVGCVDVRCVLRTHDGALIHAAYTGFVHYAENDRREPAGNVSAVAAKAPAATRVYITPRYETGHPKYAWINTLVCVGVGVLGTLDGRRYLDYSIYSLGKSE